MSMTFREWGRTADGRKVQLYTLENENGFRAFVSTYGATLTGLEVPLNGISLDVVLGFDRLEQYLDDKGYFGATIGRTANRISGGAFELDGKKYILDRNENVNTLHGGREGFSTRIWSAEQGENRGCPCLQLSYESPDGEGGYPGKLSAQVLFTLTDSGLLLEYRAVTDSPCPLSMTSHPYFNLNGGYRNLGGQELKIFSERTLAVNEQLIPSGEIHEVKGTRVDFTSFALMDGDGPEPKKHDRYYILSGSGKPQTAAVARSKGRGLEMEVITTQPGLQFYSGDGITPGTAGKNGCFYFPRSGFCLEPHGYPDAPNRKEFPSVTLSPGEEYRHSTEYRFRLIKGGS